MKAIKVSGSLVPVFSEIQAVPAKLISIELRRFKGELEFVIYKEGENYNPWEMYPDEERIVMPAPRSVAREFVRAYIRSRRILRAQWAEESAKHAFYHLWEEERLEASWRSPSASAREWAEVYGYSHDSHEMELWGGKTGSSLFGREEGKRTFSLKGGYLEERYIRFDDDGPVLISHNSVAIKGSRRVKAEYWGDSPYSSSTKTTRFSWKEAWNLFRQEMERREKEAKEEKKREELRKEDRAYRELWADMEGMRLEKGADSLRISNMYGGPHVCDQIGNYMFPIPRDCKSYRELLERLPALLEDYFANCE